jgi:hypothetical protein
MVTSSNSNAVFNDGKFEVVSRGRDVIYLWTIRLMIPILAVAPSLNSMAVFERFVLSSK